MAKLHGELSLSFLERGRLTWIELEQGSSALLQFS